MNDFYSICDDILIEELKPALGCTEPIAIALASSSARRVLNKMPNHIHVLCIAIALASSSARRVLNKMPNHIHVLCSGNIIKNVKSVTVPNSGGLKGIEAASILGVVAGDPRLSLEVLSNVSDEEREITRKLLSEKGFCTVELKEGVAGLYISVSLESDGDIVTALIKDCHNEVSSITRNGEVVEGNKAFEAEESADIENKKALLTVEKIVDYAINADLKNVYQALKDQWVLNENIAKEGLTDSYGAEVGKTFLKYYDKSDVRILKYYDKSDVRIRARAKAAAGSDARMSGCPLPVVINSGSGNQGLTVSLPVIEFGRDLNKSEDEIIRALAVSNLVAIHQKKYIGPLSAYCGAVSAAAGASAGIAFLYTHDIETISNSISNTLASVGGIVCDGAKASCAAKISSALDAAIMGFELTDDVNKSFHSGDGLVKDNVEKTIETFGKVGKDGMRETDIEILHLMMDA